MRQNAQTSLGKLDISSGTVTKGQSFLAISNLVYVTGLWQESYYLVRWSVFVSCVGTPS